MAPIIEIRNVSKTYKIGYSKVQALKNVSVSIDEGEFVSLVGPSGSGKSTLLHIMGFLDRPDEGKYIFAGQETSSFSDGKLAALRANTIGFVFQSFHLLKRTTVKDNVGLAMMYTGRDKKDEKIWEKVKDVGLFDRAYHKSNELSGGQCQKTAIARALVNEPLLLLADEPTGNLDSASRKEIMEIFKKLNDKGLTVIIVTHDEEISRQTSRIIKMKDGEIISDENSKENLKKSSNFMSLPKPRFSLSLSELLEQFFMALKSIWSNKTRSALTVLGIFIGVGSIISLMTISDGFMKSVLINTGEEDAKKLWVMQAYSPLKKGKNITNIEVEAIKQWAPLAQDITPSLYRKIEVSYGKKKYSASLATPRAEDINKQKDKKFVFAGAKVKGRVYLPQEDKNRERVAVINENLAKKIFEKEEAINSEIRVNGISFKIIGVCEDRETESLFGGEPRVYIPLQTALKRVFGQTRFDYIEISAPSVNDASAAREQVVLALRKLRPKDDYGEDDFEVKTFEVQIKKFKEVMGKISLVVYAIAGISLLVGGIGIMNIMFVSVTERTREIGLRKALGARNSDILVQFIIEAVVLCLIGGILGIGFGYSMAWLASFLIKLKPSLTMGTVSFAFGFSTLIGVGFGFWPAIKAAMLNPIEALRYE